MYLVTERVEAARRIRERVFPTPDGCWLWEGGVRPPRTRRRQVGVIKYLGRSWLAHRLAFTAWKGPIPDGFDVDHLCKQPLCVNPGHLEAVTHAENMKRTRNASATAR